MTLPGSLGRSPLTLSRPDRQAAETGVRLEIIRWSRDPVPLSQLLSRHSAGVGQTIRGVLNNAPPNNGGAAPWPDYPTFPEPAPTPPTGATPEPPTIPTPVLPPSGTPATPPAGTAPPPATSTPTVLARYPLAFHITADTTSGSSTSELRCSQPIARPFRIRELTITPLGATAIGQYVDVIIAAGADSNDTSTPSGTSIFRPLQDAASLPTPDTDPAAGVPLQPLHLLDIYESTDVPAAIKVLQRFTSPAAGLANISVTLVIEELNLTPTIITNPPTPAPTPTITAVTETPGFQPAPAEPPNIGTTNVTPKPRAQLIPVVGGWLSKGDPRLRQIYPGRPAWWY